MTMIQYDHIIDISRPVHPGMLVYPGDPEVGFETVVGVTSTHTKIAFGSHAGTHLDAPRHVREDGLPVDQLELAKLIGPCRVLNLVQVKESITVADLEHFAIKKGERLIFKTKNSEQGYEQFQEDYVYLDGDAAEWLAERDVVLIGLDALSVKQRGSRDNRAHTALLEKGIIIVESLDLASVEAGEYGLVILPLRLLGIDGAPARAVLLR